MKRKKDGDDQPGRFAYEGLDRVLHEKARLGIMTSLVTKPEGLLFGELKRLCALTDGNLSRHLDVLHEAGLVEIWKGFENRRPQTLCRLSPKDGSASWRISRSSNRSSATRCRKRPGAASARRTSRQDGSPPDPRAIGAAGRSRRRIAPVGSHPLAASPPRAPRSQLDQMSVHAVARRPRALAATIRRLARRCLQGPTSLPQRLHDLTLALAAMVRCSRRSTRPVR